MQHNTRHSCCRPICRRLTRRWKIKKCFQLLPLLPLLQLLVIMMITIIIILIEVTIIISSSPILTTLNCLKPTKKLKINIWIFLFSFSYIKINLIRGLRSTLIHLFLFLFFIGCHLFWNQIINKQHKSCCWFIRRATAINAEQHVSICKSNQLNVI